LSTAGSRGGGSGGGGGGGPLEMVLLGRGASGKVFGVVGGDGRRYALKRVASTGDRASAGVEARLHRAAGTHPHVLRLFHSWEELQAQASDPPPQPGPRAATRHGAQQAPGLPAAPRAAADLALGRLSADCAGVVGEGLQSSSRWVATLLLERCQGDLWSALNAQPSSSSSSSSSSSGGPGGVMIPLAVRARWTAELCSAVAHCHAMGICHRDVSPWNVFVTTAHRQTTTATATAASANNRGLEAAQPANAGSAASGQAGDCFGRAFGSLKLADFGLAAQLPPLVAPDFTGVESAASGAGSGGTGAGRSGVGSGRSGSPRRLRGLASVGACDLDASALGSIFAAPELGSTSPGYG
jgi:serine/threonine protein kinase